jgi:hypothetical protein
MAVCLVLIGMSRLSAQTTSTPHKKADSLSIKTNTRITKVLQDTSAHHLIAEKKNSLQKGWHGLKEIFSSRKSKSDQFERDSINKNAFSVSAKKAILDTTTHRYVIEKKKEVHNKLDGIKETFSSKKNILSHPNKDSASKNSFSAGSIKSKLDTIPQHFLAEEKKDMQGRWNGLKKSFSGPFLSFGSGYLSYNYNYRSNIDTPFIAQDVQQHLVNANLNVLVAQKFPLQVSLYERRSNNPVFKNFTDVRVDFNVQEFRRLQSGILKNDLYSVTDRLRDPHLPGNIDLQQKKWTNLNGWLQQGSLIKQLLDCKETLIYKNDIEGNDEHRDSMVQASKQFIAQYEEKQKELKQVKGGLDSMRHEYATINKKIQQLRQLFDHNMNSATGIQTIKEALHKEGIHDKRIEKVAGLLYSVRTFTVGRTMPNYSNLTVKNINVNGVNFEYNNNNLYAAVTAGTVDYRIRDFVVANQKKVPQYLLLGRLGYGLKEGNHLIVTGYKGQKQLFSTGTYNNAVAIYGVSIEGQFLINRNNRIVAEIAQSTSPHLIGAGSDSSKRGFALNDNSSKAYSFQIHSYIPSTQTRIEGQYQHNGINFQSFSSYRVNASTESWSAKLDQYFWKRKLHITASAKKNEFSNPLLLQNYSSNTIFKTLSATFRKRYWPTLTVGYIPSSQYTVINNQVYESRYQAFTANANHLYKIGTAEASSTLMYNRFYNDSRDSGFIYYNSSNYFFYQTINFQSHLSTTLNFSHTQNGIYTLDVLEGGVSRAFIKNIYFGTGFKINHTNTENAKVGLYLHGKTVIPKLGELSVWYERGYLPGWQKQLIKSEWMNISFVKYFKM